MFDDLSQVKRRYEELAYRMTTPEAMNDPAAYAAMMREYKELTPLVEAYRSYTALQKEVGLPVKPDVPLMVMVTRLAGHKGLDLLCYIARRLIWEEDAQLLILGTGEAQYESFFRDLSNQFPDQVSAQITFNLGLAARIYAGGDVYLMPSKSEPCGLSQMNAMRYGTVPVVNATGGLRDTVTPYDPTTGAGRGFTFQSYNADDFLASIDRALALYYDAPEQFAALAQQDMLVDSSWTLPAKEYMQLYQSVCGG